MKEITLTKEYITLGQLLKIVDLINSGGEAKFFLQDSKNQITVDGILENRRGRKLYSGSVVKINDKEYKII